MPTIWGIELHVEEMGTAQHGNQLLLLMHPRPPSVLNIGETVPGIPSVPLLKHDFRLWFPNTCAYQVYLQRVYWILLEGGFGGLPVCQALDANESLTCKSLLLHKIHSWASKRSRESSSTRYILQLPMLHLKMLQANSTLLLLFASVGKLRFVVRNVRGGGPGGLGCNVGTRDTQMKPGEFGVHGRQYFNNDTVRIHYDTPSFIYSMKVEASRVKNQDIRCKPQWGWHKVLYFWGSFLALKIMVGRPSNEQSPAEFLSVSWKPSIQCNWNTASKNTHCHNWYTSQSFHRFSLHPIDKP